ncbi:unnamed protein product, partial [Nesidiocoris tenuis]
MRARRLIKRITEKEKHQRPFLFSINLVKSTQGTGWSREDHRRYATLLETASDDCRWFCKFTSVRHHGFYKLFTNGDPHWTCWTSAGNAGVGVRRRGWLR